MTLLHIDSSILSEQSVSRQLTAAIVKRLVATKTETEVIYTDLAANPISHLSAGEFFAQQGLEPQDDATKQAVARSAKLLGEFLAADTIVVGAPMYNFSLPTQLRAWIDRLAVPGKTFRYTASGVEGLAKGKRIIVASTRGGLYGEGAPQALLDHQETYLRSLFGFLGITDITIIRAEGLALNSDIRDAAITAALAEAEKLTA